MKGEGEEEGSEGQEENWGKMKSGRMIKVRKGGRQRMEKAQLKRKI